MKRLVFSLGIFSALALLTQVVACGGDDPVAGGDGGIDDGKDETVRPEDSGALDPFPTDGDVNSGECDLTSPGDPCITCANQQCGNELQACYCNDTADSCDSYYNALLDCAAGDTTCEQQAAASHPGGSAAANAYESCEASKCAAACGGSS